MNKLVYLSCLILLVAVACNSSNKMNHNYVKVSADGNGFTIGDSAYRLVGTNFWYGSILASEGRGGDRERLHRELDLMQRTGINNVRLLVGADGGEGVPSHVQPVLQPSPGVYNDTILDGLDYLMAELERRGMYAVIYLNNAWEWSGGFGTYLEWATGEKAPDPAADGYKEYTEFVCRFVRNDSAKAMATDHVRRMVSRTNRYTGRPYSESPAIMSWQIANEPRPFASDSVTKEAFHDWIIATANLIHELDPNHMVSTGSEGLYGCQVDMELWARIHNNPTIDYANIHIWPSNWGWVTASTMADSIDVAIANTVEYIDMHAAVCSKPIVLEEFGYPRDGMAFAPGSPVTARDAYYSAVIDSVRSSGKIAGYNFWAWGGYGEPQHERWMPGDPYVGDPAQEPQGLYSVFATDSTTLAIIRRSAE